MLQETGKKPLCEYIEKRQAVVADWVTLRPVFKVYVKETGFEGRGRARKQWWRLTAMEWQLKTTLKEIFSAARERQQQESVRHGKGEGGLEESESGGDG